MMLSDTMERVRELQLLHVTRDMHVSVFVCLCALMLYADC